MTTLPNRFRTTLDLLMWKFLGLMWHIVQTGVFFEKQNFEGWSDDVSLRFSVLVVYVLPTSEVWQTSWIFRWSKTQCILKWLTDVLRFWWGSEVVAIISLFCLCGRCEWDPNVVCKYVKTRLSMFQNVTWVLNFFLKPTVTWPVWLIFSSVLQMEVNYTEFWSDSSSTILLWSSCLVTPCTNQTLLTALHIDHNVLLLPPYHILREDQISALFFFVWSVQNIDSIIYSIIYIQNIVYLRYFWFYTMTLEEGQHFYF